MKQEFTHLAGRLWNKKYAANIQNLTLVNIASTGSKSLNQRKKAGVKLNDLFL